MKKYLLIVSIYCAYVPIIYAQKAKVVVHYNLIFAPDLSNRLNTKIYPKAVNDVDAVDGVLRKVWPDILRIRRDRDQQDQYRLDFINKGLINIYNVNTDALRIDLKQFGDDQNSRINYIKSRNNVSRTLPKDIDKFIQEYKRVSNKASVSNNGADIWTYFQSGIDDRVVLPDHQKGQKIDKFRNIMILMTDGYIEAGIYGQGYDLSGAKVNAFRAAFLKSRLSDMNMFLSKNPKFKIKPATNPLLKNLEVIVLEMFDRSLSKTGAATRHPTDMEIMKVIWSDWFKASGVKRFELKPAASTKSEASSHILDFIAKQY